jgi:hypothetical protein
VCIATGFMRKNLELHNGGLSGDFGVDKTKECYYGRGVVKNVKKWVEFSMIYQYEKGRSQNTG